MSKPVRFNSHTTIRYNWHQFAALAQPLTTSPPTLSTIEPTMPFWLLQTCTTECRSQCQSLDAWTLARSQMIGDDWAEDFANDWSLLPSASLGLIGHFANDWSFIYVQRN